MRIFIITVKTYRKKSTENYLFADFYEAKKFQLKEEKQKTKTCTPIDLSRDEFNQLYESKAFRDNSRLSYLEP